MTGGVGSRRARGAGVSLWERSGAEARPSAAALREWRCLLIDTYPWYCCKV
jgi:hypothetical protein